ncbi:ABC-three component system middle component 5 [Pseudomonas coleopterorum]|uniref:ABC-three component system middle component 5 n=1 Tax=Pseudomonas coleopterorum TaxID=1605838 RepID=UPI0028AC9930|nr:ABC-three component system middle component 5 [Pseudomonas coleopterorum]
MLMYHPAFDANHCLYRIVSILHATGETQVSWPLLRMLDFYYLFPGQLKCIHPWPREISKMKAQVSKIPEQFEDLTNAARTFFELETFQKSATLELIAKGVISKSAFDKGIMELEPESLSAAYIDLLATDDFLTSDAFAVITKGLPAVQFGGSKGLKSRSGLMEYIYDL